MRQKLAGLILAVSCVMILAQGCATHSVDEKRLVRYQPDTEGRTPWLWRSVDTSGAGTPAYDVGTKGATVVEEHSAASTRFVRRLRTGGRVTLHLTGIPRPEQIQEVVDDLGCVSLPLIGVVKLAGLTTSEAEEKIAKAYIESGYYT